MVLLSKVVDRGCDLILRGLFELEIISDMGVSILFSFECYGARLKFVFLLCWLFVDILQAFENSTAFLGPDSSCRSLACKLFNIV